MVSHKMNTQKNIFFVCLDEAGFGLNTNTRKDLDLVKYFRTQKFDATKLQKDLKEKESSDVCLKIMKCLYYYFGFLQLHFISFLKKLRQKINNDGSFQQMKRIFHDRTKIIAVFYVDIQIRFYYFFKRLFSITMNSNDWSVT